MKRRRETFLLLLVGGLRSSCTLLATFALTRLFAPEMFAEFRAAMIVSAVLMTILSTPVSQSLLYLYPTTAVDQRRALISNTFFSLAALTGATIAVAALFRTPLRGVLPLMGGSVMLGAACLTVAQTMVSGLPVIAIAQGNLVRSAKYELTLGLSILLASIAAPLAGAGPTKTLLAVTLAQAPLFFIGWRQVGFHPAAIDRTILRRQWALAGPVGLATVLGSFGQQLDKLVVAGLFTPAQFAVYVCGAIELPLAGLLPFVVTRAIAPKLAESFQRNDVDAFLGTLHETMRVTLLVMCAAFIFFFVAAHPLMAVLFTRGYASAAAPFRIFLSLLLLRVTHYGLVLQATGRATPMVLSGCLSVGANIVMAVLLIPVWGPVGAAVAAVIGQIVNGVVLLWATKRALAVPFRRLAPWGVFGRITAVAAIAFAGALLLARVFPGGVGVGGSAIAGAAAFTAAAFLFRFVQRRDWEWIGTLAGDRWSWLARLRS